MEIGIDVSLSPPRYNKTGYVHRKLRRTPSILLDGEEGIQTLLQHASGTGIEVTVPPVAQYMTWIASGGGGSGQFMIPGNGHSPSHDLLQKDWDAIGAEIGTSDLDHSDDSDSEVVRFPLKPGQHERVRILFRYLDRDGAERLERNIRAYQLTLG